VASALSHVDGNGQPQEEPVTTREVIDALIRSTGASDPVAAIRSKARDSIERFRQTFGEPTMPFDVEALASFLGIRRSDAAPSHSEDAELVPIGDGRVEIRVNPDRPETRRRFSVAHEISHTFFPNYQIKKWCRTDARHRRRDNPDDLLEKLCDIGASELILPAPWFIQDAASVTSGAGLVDLARKYVASREATVRRFAESHSGEIAAVFLSWKLKPTQEPTVGNIDQGDLFGTDPTDRARLAKRLRLDYSIPSRRFLEAGTTCRQTNRSRTTALCTSPRRVVAHAKVSACSISAPREGGTESSPFLSGLKKPISDQQAKTHWPRSSNRWRSARQDEQTRGRRRHSSVCPVF
jgi:hypothetical protein